MHTAYDVVRTDAVQRQLAAAAVREAQRVGRARRLRRRAARRITSG